MERYGLMPVDLTVELLRRGIDASVVESNYTDGEASSYA
jgi:hypothetical protein